MMNLIPNSENMKPIEPPCLEGKIVLFGKNIGNMFTYIYEKSRAT